MLDVFQNKFWTQHVDFATHSGGNILDLALSSSSELVHGVSEVDGDHTLLKVDVVGPAIEKDSMELVPDWTKADLDGLKETFASMDWDDALKDMSGLEAWEFFRNFMDEETEKHVPK